MGYTAFIITLIVADLDDLSGILGFHFLSENNAIFDLKKGVLNFFLNLESKDNLTRIEKTKFDTGENKHIKLPQTITASLKRNRGKKNYRIR